MKLSKYIPLVPTLKQAEVLSIEDKREILFSHGIGAGGTTLLLMAALQYAGEPKAYAVFVKPAYLDLMIPGGPLDTITEWIKPYSEAQWHRLAGCFSFPGGANLDLHCPSSEHKMLDLVGRYQTICIDNLEQFSYDEYNSICRHLRPTYPFTARPLRILSTCHGGTLKSDHWITQYFGRANRDKRAVVFSDSIDNPYLEVPT